MVNLNDLFKALATGEFSNMNLSRTSTGNLNEQEYAKVVGHLNLGIVELYKRFKFLKNEVVLHADPTVTTYYLRPDRIADLGAITTAAYLQTPDSLEGALNIIEVTGVWDSVGDEVKLNNRFLTPSVRQMAPDILKIDGLDAATTFLVEYQAFPTKIIIDDTFDPKLVDLPISDTIVEALLYYVAYRVYRPVGSNDSTANADKSSMYQQQYELACQKIELYGLDIDPEDKDNTFEAKGWV